MLDGVFRFNARHHRYYVGDYVVPGTSQILRAGGLIPEARFFTAASRYRGTSAHACIEAVLTGQLACEDLEQSPYLGYVTAACKALVKLCEGKECDVELCVVNREFGYATRVDILADDLVLNWKTGRKKQSDAIQSALEAMAVASGGELIAPDRYSCYLDKDGGYLLEAHTNDGDFEVALEAIDAWQKTKHDPKRHPPLESIAVVLLQK